MLDKITTTMTVAIVALIVLSIPLIIGAQIGHFTHPIVGIIMGLASAYCMGVYIIYYLEQEKR